MKNLLNELCKEANWIRLVILEIDGYGHPCIHRRHGTNAYAYVVNFSAAFLPALNAHNPMPSYSSDLEAFEHVCTPLTWKRLRMWLIFLGASACTTRSWKWSCYTRPYRNMLQFVHRSCPICLCTLVTGGTHQPSEQREAFFPCCSCYSAALSSCICGPNSHCLFLPLFAAVHSRARRISALGPHCHHLSADLYRSS
jgi:hypothetical protein